MEQLLHSEVPGMDEPQLLAPVSDTLGDDDSKLQFKSYIRERVSEPITELDILSPEFEAEALQILNVNYSQESIVAVIDDKPDTTHPLDDMDYYEFESDEELKDEDLNLNNKSKFYRETRSEVGYFMHKLSH